MLIFFIIIMLNFVLVKGKVIIIITNSYNVLESIPAAGAVGKDYRTVQRSKRKSKQ